MNTANQTAGVQVTPAEPSFVQLYDEYLPKIFQYVSYRISEKQADEDITSEIFNKALTHFARYDSRKGAFSTWIFTIARRVLIDFYRASEAERKLVTCAIESQYSQDYISPEEQAIRSDEVNKLRDCLKQLKPVEQEIISLKFGAGMKNREIASIIRLSGTNVGTILCRAVRKLRDALQEQ